MAAALGTVTLASARPQLPSSLNAWQSLIGAPEVARAFSDQRDLAFADTPVAREMQVTAGEMSGGDGVITITKSVNGVALAGSLYTVTVTGESGDVITTRVSPGNPSVLTGLIPGVYTITEQSPGAGWVQSYNMTSGQGIVGSANVVVTLTYPLLAPVPSGTQIKGVAFNDFNSDGIKGTNNVVTDTGVQNVTVTAYAGDGSVAGTATTDASGLYTITTTIAGPWRVEFTNLPAGTEPSRQGSGSATSVQFVTSVAAANNINFGLLDPNLYSQSDIRVVASLQWVGGAASSMTSPTLNAGLGSLPFASTGDPTGAGDINQPNMSRDVATKDVGSVWGLAYQKSTKRVYAGALLKRHFDLGSLVRPAIGAPAAAIPVDGIYMADYSSSTSGTYVGGFQVNGVTPSGGNVGSINTGSVQRQIIASPVTPARPYALSTIDASSYDVDAFLKAGTIGFGDVEISEDNNSLWVVNLNQKSLIRIDVSNPGALPVTGAIGGSLLQHWSIDTSALPICAGNFRPWALNFYKGFGYVGMTCDAMNSSSENLRAYVLKFNPANPTAFTLVSTVNMDPSIYKRESSQYALINPATDLPFTPCSLGTSQGWNRWATSWADFGLTTPSASEVACPQPLLSGISFDLNGDMILSIMDRSTLQIDQGNMAPDFSFRGIINIDAGGDTIHVCNTTSGYVVEGYAGCVIDSDTFGSATGLPPNRPLQLDGPNGVGEFYYQDNASIYLPDGSDTRHAENNLGANLTLPGSGQVMVTVLDPIDRDFNQGFHWYKTRLYVGSGALGSRSSQYQIEPTSTGPSVSTPMASKGSRLGDIELLLQNAPIEIGNRVWDDINRNGIQDPGEPGMAGVTVTLQTASGSISVNTDANGRYGFTREATSGAYSQTLQPNTAYTISIALPGTYTVTQANAGAILGSATGNHAINDTRDSDALLTAGVPTIYYTTGNYGQNNHGLDFGLYRAPLATVAIINTPPVLIGNHIWQDNGTPDGVYQSTDKPLPGVVVTATSSTGKVYTAMTDANGQYTIPVQANDTYTVTYAPQADLTPSNTGSSAINATTNDTNHVLGVSVAVTMTDNLHIDFALTPPPVKIGTHIWQDNGTPDGVYQATDKSLPGIVVTATSSTGKTYTATTDANGVYTIPVPANDTYTVTYAPVAGLNPSNTGTSATDAASNDTNHALGVKVAVTTTDNPHLDFALTPPPVTIGSHIWQDNGVPDGVYQPTDKPLSGVVVTATSSTGKTYTTTTDANGQYTLTVPANDTYTVTYAPQPGLSPSTSGTSATDAASNGTNHVLGVSVSVTTVGNPHIDFALALLPVKIGSHIWQDNGTPDGVYQSTDKPLPGVVVTATSSTGKTYIATTDADGVYMIPVPANDTYTVTYEPQPGLSPSTAGTSATHAASNDTNHALGVRVAVTITDNPHIDFALTLPPVLIGSHIWQDIGTPDGVYQASDKPLSGVIVIATSSTGKTYTATTDANGVYTIPVPANDNYTVSYKPQPNLAPSTLGTSATDAASNDTNHVLGVSVAMTTANNLNLDFALAVPVSPASLGDYTWIDVNGNGVQDAGEPPLAGVVITLTGLPGGPITTTSSLTGFYQFTGLTPGVVYTLTFSPMPGYTFTSNNGPLNSPSNSDANPQTGVVQSVVLANGENNRNIDVGYMLITSLGDYTWFDVNHNGIQDKNEPPLAGVPIKLTGPNGTISTTSNASGYYQFTGLIPGVPYTVTFGIPAGYTYTINTGALNDATNSDANPATGMTQAVILTPGQNNPNIDVGYFMSLSLGNLVWLDVNQDGIFNSSEPRLGNVLLLLKTASGKQVATQSTNSQGNYLFTDLLPDSYIVEVAASNFITGGLLEVYKLSPRMGGNNIDNLSNGKTVNDVVQSGVIVMNYGTQPITETDDPSGGDNNSNLTVDFGFYPVPNAVTLTNFDVKAQDSSARLSWSTSAERDTLGFNVYRAEGTHTQRTLPNGATRVTSQIIPAIGPQGGSYNWTDNTTQASHKYSYYLVEVEMDGSEHVYGPVQMKNTVVNIFLPIVKN